MSITEQDLHLAYTELSARLQNLHQRIRDERLVRFGHDETPERWRRTLASDIRVRTRLSHNNVRAVVSALLRNPPRITIPPMTTGDSDVSKRARSRSDAQERFARAIIPALERQARRPIMRRFLDYLVADGVSAIELYLTGSYDDIDTEMGEDETPRQYALRIAEAVRKRPLPFMIREIDPLELLWEEDGAGPCLYLIATYIPYRSIYRELHAAYGDDISDLLPDPRTSGTGAFDTRFVSGDSVLVLRYYDKDDYAISVGGKLVEAHKHPFPFLPIIHAYGIVTGSPEPAEAYQGVNWAIAGLETALNNVLTVWYDNELSFGPPRPVVRTQVGGQRLIDPQGRPVAIRLDDPFQAVQLGEGQEIHDAFAEFRNRHNMAIPALLEKYFSAASPREVLTGEAPGADIAGYTMNLLQESAMTPFRDFQDSYARALGDLIDAIRQTIKHVIGQTVSIWTYNEDPKRGSWLDLSPKDIDEAPTIVTIDPLSPQSRIALRQSLMEANRAGYISRARVQKDGFLIEDPEAEDDQIILEKAMERLAEQAVQLALQKAIAEAGIQPQGQGLQPGSPPAPQGQNPLAPVGGPFAPVGNATGGRPSVPPQTEAAEAGLAPPPGAAAQ